MDPRLSVIVPTFRREREVVEAVRSVLRHPSPGIELIVVDDSPEGSAEGPLRAFQDSRFFYHKREVPSGGRPALVRNEAVRRWARGSALYFLDDDDTVEMETLLEMVNRMEAAGAGVAIGVVLPHGDEASPIVTWERKAFEMAAAIWRRPHSRFRAVSKMLFHHPGIVCSACAVRREIFERIGGFDPNLPLYEDIDMYLRAIRDSGHIFLDKPLLNRRTAAPSLINNERDSQRTLQSYRIMHSGYKARQGLLEYAWLKLLSFTMANPAQ